MQLILVFDLSNPKSFENLEGWLQEVQKYGLSRECPTIVVGNMVSTCSRHGCSSDIFFPPALERIFRKIRELQRTLAK